MMENILERMKEAELQKLKILELYASLSPARKQDMEKILNPSDTLLINNFNKGIEIKDFYEGLEPSQQSLLLSRFTKNGEEILALKWGLGIRNNPENVDEEADSLVLSSSSYPRAENIYSKSPKM